MTTMGMDSTLSIERPAATPPRRINRLARQVLFGRLNSLVEGRIEIRDGDGTAVFGAAGNAGPLGCSITVNRPRFYRRLLTGGTLAAAAAYLDGDWDCDDLTALFRCTLRGLGRTDLDRGSIPTTTAARMGHWLRRNTLRGSRRNIRDHYDLGNDLFALFLDEGMTYSAGIFEHPGATLEEAQRAKLDRLCRKLELGPRDHVLEIGSGWGSFALHAAGTYDCRVTTTTLSPAQYEVAVRRVREAGLSDRVTVVQEDYRALSGTYDKLVAIEMIEAVGADHLGIFFSRCADLLKPDGRMAIQVITTGEQYYEAYRRSVDFIQRYVFPGSHCPSLGALIAASGKSTDLRVVHLEDLTAHYARTLQEWRARFLAQLTRVRELGYPERFIRLWDFYLQYCEAGFAERHIGDLQILLAKSEHRRGAPLPDLPIPEEPGS
ncbi:class I SAM-dependent methyltransferase [Thiohalorhabdus methylotrophus]|uniref:Class I SAM-dependent methyltransferase n=1 Tax=Thiohalorhabdus methylotrophus TaxID=3242694 RepID=A0ABV4TUP3_9GAMM